MKTTVAFYVALAAAACVCAAWGAAAQAQLLPDEGAQAPLDKEKVEPIDEAALPTTGIPDWQPSWEPAGGPLPPDGQPRSPFCNTGAITIPSSGTATPYPSTINVSGLTGVVASVTVDVFQMNHTYPDDIDILLVGPTGASCILMSDCGGSYDLVNVNLTFADAAATSLPDSTQISGGTYKPTNIGSGDPFAAPAPAGPYGTALNAFNMTDPNGDWKLYVVDDAGGDFGSIAGGWCLNIISVTGGSCCVGHTCVSDVSQTYCETTLGGVYNGDGSICTPNPCQAACCYNYPDTLCTDVSQAECTALSGIWHLGQACASFSCPPWNDDCSAVTPQPLTVGIKKTFTGDNRGATNDCASFAGGQVWIAFTVPTDYAQYSLTLDYCGSGLDGVPFGASWLNMTTGCPCTTPLTSAGTFDTTTCADGNRTIRWSGILPGTYYYPVLLDPANNAAGPYVIRVVCRPGYCESRATSSLDSTIDNVTFGDADGIYINNSTDPLTCDTYDDFTSLTAEIFRGVTYPISVTVGDCTPTPGGSCYPKWIKVFFDWNGDYDFDDPGEQVLSTSVTNNPCVQTVNGFVVVPQDAVESCTRMRVVVRESGTEATTLPCGTYSYGATEDYTVCIGVPSPFGACCYVSGGTVVCDAPLSREVCEAAPYNGVYKGDGSSCSPINPCFGACCHPDGSCTMEASANCTAPSVYKGDGVPCESASCPQPGGCCTPDGYCYMSTVVGGDCAAGDFYRGDNTNCDTACPPRNDECVNAIPTGEVTDLGFDTSGATTSGIGIHSIYKDIWYCYTATCDASVIVDTCGATTYDTKIAVWEGCACPPTVELAYDDDNGPGCSGTRASVQLAVTAGNSYLIQVGAYSSSGGGLGDLSITCLLPPANDTCATATVIPWMPFSDSVDARGAMDDVGPSCGTGATRYGVWYTYTPAVDCALVISETSSNDVVISVHTGTDCNGIWELACSGPDSMVVPGLVGGTQYWILIGLYSATGAPTGLYTVDFDCVLPPPNDTCAAATNIAWMPYSDTVDARGAADDVGPSCGTEATRYGVWYTYTPTVDCALVVSETSANDVVISVQTGADCNGLWEVACSSPDSMVVPGLIAGTQYWVLIGMYSATAAPTGPYTVDFDCILPPSNDTCDTATVIPGLPYSDSPAAQGANPDFALTCSTNPATNFGVWYTFTPTFDCNAIITETSSNDVNIAVFTGTNCSDIWEYACSTADTATVGGLTAGTQYWILVGMGSATVSPTVPYALTIDCVPPPPNDLCANATPVAEGEFSWDNNSAATDGLPFSAACPGDIATNVQNDVWFLYTATCTDTATVSTCNAPYGQPPNVTDTVIAVYSAGICPPTDDLRIACDDDIDAPFTCTASTLRSTLEFPAVAGTPYLIRVGSYSATVFGAGVLTISQPPCSGCVLMGDMNGDFAVNGQDVQDFVNCAVGGGTNCACGDFYYDGWVNELDIPDFVAALLAP